MLSPGYHFREILVDGMMRRYRIYVPAKIKKDPRTGLFWYVLACDGVLKGKEPIDRMAQFGLDEIAELYGFVVIYLEPLPRQARPWLPRKWSIIWGWNTPGGMLLYRPGYDDAHFAKAVVDAVNAELGAGHWCGAGFSAGAQFLHIVAGRYPGLLQAIVAVGGTLLGTEPGLPPGIHLVVFHSDGNPRVPYTGGLSRHWLFWYFTLRTLTTLLAIGLKAFRSKPYAQFIGYGVANGVELKALRALKFTKYHDHASLRRAPTGRVVLAEFKLHKKLRGHDWHRREGFDTNQAFAEALGLNALVEA